MILRHPYRGDRVEPPGVVDHFEERILSVVLLVAGALGAAVGLASPRANATELVLGTCLLLVGLWTLRHSRTEPVV